MSTSFFMRYRQRFALAIISTALSFNALAADMTDGAASPDFSKATPQDSTALLLEQITVSAGLKSVKNSPLRLQSVDDSEIRNKAVGRTYPELLREIPGIYSTAETGSYGDAKINAEYRRKGIRMQCLSCCRITFPDSLPEPASHLSGRTFSAPVPWIDNLR